MAGLFAYYFVQQSLNQGVRSVVSGGRLILNTAFPRALLPISSVITAFLRFVPTFLIYIPVHFLSGLSVGPQTLWLIPILAILAVFAMGVTMLVAAGQVYVRDLKNFLPYATRIWLYSTPILYYSHEVPDRYDWILTVNPLASIISAWSTVIDTNHAPALNDVLIGTAWAVGVFLVAAVFFVSREREFAVRL
jgi:ABC-type polysaccharide/polyol phosphate export permease